MKVELAALGARTVQGPEGRVPPQVHLWAARNALLRPVPGPQTSPQPPNGSPVRPVRTASQGINTNVLNCVQGFQI